MNRSRNSAKRTDSPRQAVAVKTNQRILYGTLAMLGMIALVIVGISLFRLLTTASQPQTQPALSVQQAPQTFPTPPPSVAYSVEAEALFLSLNCLCGTCNDTLEKCDCGQARSMKGYVDSLVESGISRSEVLDKVVEKYGQQALVSAE